MIDRLIQNGALRRWAVAARRADEEELPVLKRQRALARQLKQHLDVLIHKAERRLARPLPDNQHFPRPHDTDWAWRPDAWCGPLPVQGLSPVPTQSQLGEGTTAFHDSTLSEITLRQLRNTRATDLAAYGLRMDVFRFDGSFLSLALDLPPGAGKGLQKRHIIRFEALVEMERPIEIFARLNIRHGPNTEQIVRELSFGETPARIEFDLAYTQLNERRVEKMWLDLIFENPQMNQISLRDVTFSRRPRAEL